ncbi:MAG: PQQ-dependent sugar dehydrogenase [Vicinamibacterales bacterium]
MHRKALVAALALWAATPALTASAQVADPRPPNAPTQKPAFAGQTDAPDKKLGVAFDIVTLSESLRNPWGMTFLPNGKILVTEKVGFLRVVNADGTLTPQVVGGLPAVDNRGQGGLLDVTLDPNYATNNLIYWSYSEARENGSNNTAVARGKFVEGPPARVENAQVIYHQGPSLNSTAHYGSRLNFLKDGTLLITHGERSITEGRMQAQRMDGLLGKVARINADGSIPKDNPFVGRANTREEIFTIGHRNIQSAVIHPTTGELWEVEHGTRGGDELNVVRKGKDYGWPTVAYGIEYAGPPITGGITQKEGTEQPLYYWDPVIGPSGMAFYTGDLFPAWKGSLFIGGHQTNDLVRLSLDGEKITGEERLLTDRTPRLRIRDVRQGPDGALYLLTDEPLTGKLLKLVPKK